MDSFKTWVFAGATFLSVPTDNGVHVVDSCGNNYGAWYSVERFRKMQRRKEKAEIKTEPIGKCRVKIISY